MCRTQCVLALVALFLGLVHSWDVALVTLRDQVEFYTENRKMHTVRFDSQNLTALVYDEVHNILLYVDKQNNNDAICGYIIDSGEYKCYIQRNGTNIQGLAFDPITEILFFTDTKERSINWISFKSGSENSFNVNRLIKMADGIPTDIAVDSCRGFIYWINSNLTTTTIDRARYNGSEREVVINASHNADIHSLAIDQQTQNIYWILRVNSSNAQIYTADLNGKNQNLFKKPRSTLIPNSIAISKEYVIVLYLTNRSRSLVSYYRIVSDNSTSTQYPQPTFVPKIYLKNPVFALASKHKISDQIQGVEACKALTSLVPNNSITYDSLKTAREYVEQYCVHGIKDIGQSLCKCTPGYIGKRCDVSVCENYCLQGDCSFNAEGLPNCRCNAGYNGERCEVNVCHGYCSNNGTCSLNADSEPVCQCIDGYAGDRCEITDCLNYCLQGDCSFNIEGLPKCRCNAGYSGERCDLNVCHGYCSNNGTCSLNADSEPVCQCIDDYAGDRCEIVDCLNYCLQGDCSFNVEGLPKCRCNAGYYGERCEVNACHGYCLNNGNCTSNQENEPVCQCIDNYLGDRCEIPDCVNYCVQGDCSFSEEGVPECRCNAGYNGERCEVSVCHGYCSNNGTCSLNEENEPVCQCIDNYAGDRCDVPICLNNGVCSLNEEGSRCKADKNNTSFSPLLAAQQKESLP